MTERRRRVAFVVLVALQLAALLGLIGWRLYLLRTGQTVLLRCEPVDPRSILSGDYVELNYTVSRFSRGQLAALGRKDDVFREHETVYVALERPAGERFHRAVAISRDLNELRQRHPIVLRGVVVGFWGELRLRYGVEHYFVPQNEGPRIERRMREASVELAVGASGESAIRRLFLGGEEVRFY